MSPPDSSGSSLPKRRRTVEGSCWPCKQRRVKCDLQKPCCRRCINSDTQDCSYDKVLLRWKKRPAKPVPQPQPRLSREYSFNGLDVALNERKAIDYFRARIWPLFSTLPEPCPAPVALALRSQPVLQALCVFAEEHRALQAKESPKPSLSKRRLQCLAAIRTHLGGAAPEGNALSALLVAVLLLYFLEGYVNCTNDGASTHCHFAGLLAIINALGGFQAAWTSSDRVTRMLLSEMASTDLTDALLQDRPPSFPATIWSFMEPASVWWDTVPGSRTLGSVFSTMAEMSFYRHQVQNGADFCMDQAQAFERALQPTYPTLDNLTESRTSELATKTLAQLTVEASLSLIIAFQHAALIYLYSALHNIPAKHYLVQQHVKACLDCIQSMDPRTKAQNCALFPLYVAGAHSLDGSQRTYVSQTLETINKTLQFESVASVLATLDMLWQSSHSPTGWVDSFKDTATCTLVI
ncbi:hypothetical protein COCMIDRAFT_108257 [Bipolaris oryzae ATCC 44560]|uniref:Zn(2)-C6 fungal-type domain-containing protein n=1 Tax=Bipolaris oryzae ATCC 44560 TaxID=930090 RepID=W6ZA95_COCMI|nr:uncharacterized protein COCMIDRAFT_108257 [Bipolaris oryzae ATCC 44560]EUC40651.1 hypothetical protein COCMIDRAFT_108257 [Bipolaris oryzae ATCC 44560]